MIFHPEAKYLELKHSPVRTSEWGAIDSSNMMYASVPILRRSLVFSFISFSCNLSFPIASFLSSPSLCPRNICCYSISFCNMSTPFLFIFRILFKSVHFPLLWFEPPLSHSIYPFYSPHFTHTHFRSLNSILIFLFS